MLGIAPPYRVTAERCDVPAVSAVIEVTEEAVYNSLLQATTITGRGHTVEALPLDRTMEILRHFGAIDDRRGASP